MKPQVRIKIYTRSFSLELYSLSRKLYEDMNIPIVRLTDQTADGYFYTMLQDMECDIAINIDEDAFVLDTHAICHLVDLVVQNDYANAGSPDGGMDFRVFNPIVTNPFFNVLNLRLIRQKRIDKATIQTFDYAKVSHILEQAFPKEMLFGRYDFNCMNQEPYYPFFFWLAYNFKTLYLPSQKHEDGITTILLMPDAKTKICYHTWFARFYKSSILVHIFNKKRGVQTKRIDNIITEAYQTRQLQRPKFGFRNHLQFRWDTLLRWSIKVPQRVMGWPRKWAKWYRRWKRKRQGTI